MTIDEDKGKKIRTTAIRLFAEHGFEKVKISDITCELGMGKGTFYLYYKNKRDLLLECFEQLKHLVESFESRKQIKNEKDFCTRMKYRMIALEENYQNTIGLLNLLRIESNSNDKEISNSARKAYEAIIDPLKDDIETAVRNTQQKHIDSELGAYLILGIAESLSFLTNVENKLADDAVDIFYDTIRRSFINRH